MSSPTSRSLALLREHGLEPWVAEYWNPHARRRVDLFNIFDIVALGHGHTYGIQVCSACDVSKRIHKIMDSPWTDRARLAGWIIQVHGWRAPTKTLKTWRPRIEELTRYGWTKVDSPTVERSRDPAPGAAPAPGPGGARPPSWHYACSCGHTFSHDLGRYGCPNCHATQGPASLIQVAHHTTPVV